VLWQAQGTNGLPVNIYISILSYFNTTPSLALKVKPQHLEPHPRLPGFYNLSNKSSQKEGMRNKKRDMVEISDDDEDATPARKHAKNNQTSEQKVDLGMALTGFSASLDRALKERKEAQTDSQKAIKLLESAYGNRLSMMDFITACNFFKDDKNAGVFLMISDIHRRDRWLEISLAVVLELGG
jgi:hypothetical protein